MPIAPKPYKLKCSKCGYSKIVKLTSGCLSIKDLLKISNTYPKCYKKMQSAKMRFLEETIDNSLNSRFLSN